MLPFTSAQPLQAEASSTRPTPTKSDEDQAPTGAGFEDVLDAAESQEDLALDGEPDVAIIPIVEPAPRPQARHQLPAGDAPRVTMSVAAIETSSLPNMDTKGSALASATPMDTALAPLALGGGGADLPEATASTASTGALPVVATQSEGDGSKTESTTTTVAGEAGTKPEATGRDRSGAQPARTAPVSPTPTEGAARAETTAPTQGSTPNHGIAAPGTSTQGAAPDSGGNNTEHAPAQGEPTRRTMEASSAERMKAANPNTEANAATPTATATATATEASPASHDAPSKVQPVAGVSVPATTEAAPAQPTEGLTRSAPQSTRPVEVPEIGELLEQVRVRLSPRRPEITVLLDPPELGRLFIKLAMKGGELTATVTADDARAARVFEGDIGRLYRTLDDAGIRVVEIEIRTALDSSSDSDKQRDGQRASAESEDDERADNPDTDGVRGTPRSQQDSAQPSRTVAKSRASTLDLVI